MGSKEFSRKCFLWLDQINTDFELSATCTKVAVQLVVEHFNEDDEDGRAYPGGKYIGDAIGVSESGVFKAIRQMHARGHLRVIWGNRGRGHPNQYWMILKPNPSVVLKGEKPNPSVVLADHKTTLSSTENHTLKQIKPHPSVENHKTNHRGNHAVVRAPLPVGDKGGQHAAVVDGSDQPAAGPGFEAFWAVYPKQVGKLAAKREYEKALQEGATAEEINAGARRYAVDPARIKQSSGADGDRFTKNPNNWLREGKWADKLNGVIIDEHGNAVAQPAQQNGGIPENVARTIARYPNGGRSWQ